MSKLKEMQQISILRPDDFHVHLRDGALLEAVAVPSARVFGRALLMPNLMPPLRTVAQVASYRQRVLSVLKRAAEALSEPQRSRVASFQPFFTLYLTEDTPPSAASAAAESDFILGFKLYPAGATTNSQFGVKNLEKLYPFFEALEKQQGVLLVHGEDASAELDPFDRERYFIAQELIPLREKFPNLKITLEHITTKEAVEFVRSAPSQVAATITAHHLLLNRQALFAGGVRPHHYCLPLLKREKHRQAVLAAAVSDEDCFFLGTDSAPHEVAQKEAACGCAGMYTAPVALSIYASLFERAGALERLEAFASKRGAAHYGLPAPTEKITLVKKPLPPPPVCHYSDQGKHKTLMPFLPPPEVLGAGAEATFLAWSVLEEKVVAA